MWERLCSAGGYNEICDLSAGKLPKVNPVPWRGDSGLKDGLSSGTRSLVGGFYDSGANVKINFPLAYMITVLSWTVLEYEEKYKMIGEYEHVRDIIKWGSNYLMLTFEVNSPTIESLYAQVGVSHGDPEIQDDFSCWQRPEDMAYKRPVQVLRDAPDVAAEMAAALAAASIAFQEDATFSRLLVDNSIKLYHWATSTSNKEAYSSLNKYTANFYNSTSIFDEHLWGATWLFLATGNFSYLSKATDQGLAADSKAFSRKSNLRAGSWDNKLPSAGLLLTRVRMFLDPGYPYEALLHKYNTETQLTMCSYLEHYQVFKRTKGGLILLRPGLPKPLQYASHSVFLASQYLGYVRMSGIGVLECGRDFALQEDILKFVTSQVKYILGENPMNMSYLVGYGKNFPGYVHHRGASIPSNTKQFSCKDGWVWFRSKNPNPNIVKGAMVGGPDLMDMYKDSRADPEPTLVGNTELVAALISMTAKNRLGINRNRMFSAIPPFFSSDPSPPPPWKP